MLLETLEYIVTPCDADFRKLGYLTEAIATEARRRRCAAEWADHLDRTRAVIRAAVERTPGSNLAVVLGGGMLADIPLDDLAARFARVVLIDVCFTCATRLRAKAFRNVELRVADITGRARAILRSGKTRVQGAADLPGAPPRFDEVAEADLVVSANVLSQLPLIPLDVLRRRGCIADPEAERDLGRAMIEEHLRLLDSCPGTTCLVSETRRETCDGDAVLETEDALFGARLPDAEDGWAWHMAPRPEIHSDRDVRLAVAVVIRS